MVDRPLDSLKLLAVKTDAVYSVVRSVKYSLLLYSLLLDNIYFTHAI